MHPDSQFPAVELAAALPSTAEHPGTEDNGTEHQGSGPPLDHRG
jgi:hypothetical protein